MEDIGKVTLSLEEYEKMKKELNFLREIVKEKTIYKYYTHPVYGYVTLVIIFAIMFYCTLINHLI